MNHLKTWFGYCTGYIGYWLRLEILAEDDEFAGVKIAYAALSTLVVLILWRVLL